MRIERLTVRNFRNLADIDIELAPGTVIVGENRAGKSNLLHALRLILDTSLPNADRHLGREDFWDGLSDGSADWDPMANGDVVEISITMADFDGDPKLLVALSDALLTGEPVRAQLTYRWAPRDDETPGSGSAYIWSIFGAGDPTRKIAPDLREYIYLAFLHALRDVESDIRAWRRSPLRRLLQAAASAASEGDLEDVRSAIEEANVRINDLGPIKALADRITDHTADMVGEHHQLETALAVGSQDPLRLIRSMQVFVDGEAKRPLATASLGTLNVLYLALLELGLENRIDTSEIAHVLLAVEEPEAHLHPHLQRVIFRRLLEEHQDRRTTIVTTQSPHIASVAPPQSLIVLRSVDGETRAAVAANAQLSPEEWGDVGRYLDVTRAELIFARKVLLVEGYAEEVLIPALCRHLGLDLDKAGITVCAIHGTHFRTYAKLCDALDIPWAVLTDGDLDPDGQSIGKRRAKTLAESFDLAARPETLGIFVGDSTFEYDLATVSADNQVECFDALRELCSATSVAKIDAWKGMPPYDDFMRMITNAGGKGRYAQRLSLSDLGAPKYILSALDYLESR